MKTTTLLLTICCCFGNFITFSQNLLTSPQGSAFSYLYRISNEEAGDICRKQYWIPEARFFHSLQDSFPSDSVMNLPLTEGHYLQVRIVKNELHLDLLTVQHFDVVALNNSTDLCLAVYDTLGRVLSDAVLDIDGRRIPFDPKSQSYRLPKTNRKGLLSATHGGMTAWYNLNRHWNNPTVKRMLNQPPLRYVYRPLKIAGRASANITVSLIKGRYSWAADRIGRFFVCLLNPSSCNRNPDATFQAKYRGYLVFNKPKYLPNDTVRLKAFLTDNRGKPLTDSVSVVLYKEWNVPLTLARIAPWQPGAFDFAFPLHDSLGLQLDKNYQMALQMEKGMSYIKGSFRYEDYELKSATLALRSDEDTQFRGKEFRCYLQATDENDLHLMDARVELILLPGQASVFHATQVFVPDTLWHWEQTLEPAGETTLVIPDSIFPAVDMPYTLLAVMLTSDNERVSKDLKLRFFHTRREFHLEVQGDSVRFEYRENGSPLPTRAILSGYDPLGNSVEERLVALPHTEKINPWFESYQLDDGLIKQHLSLASEPAQLRCLSDRSLDSMRIFCENPRQIPFRYFLYRHNRELLRGYGTDLDLARASGERES